VDEDKTSTSFFPMQAHTQLQACSENIMGQAGPQARAVLTSVTSDP